MKKQQGNKGNVLWMTELALMAAIVIIMTFTPLGYLRVGAIEVTFIVIPVAVGAVMLGVKGGAILGLIFGLTSFAQCFGMSAFGTMLFGVNPVGTAFACIVPRICVGVVPALLYKIFRKIDKKDGWSIAVSCLLSPLTNTALYLACVCFIFQKEMMEMYKYTGKGGLHFLFWVFALVALNAILEAVSSLFIGTAICKTLKKVFRQ